MSYGSTRAVDGVSLTVGPGQAFGLVGPDGAGKTTTMRLLVGLLAAGRGEVTILGLDVHRAGVERAGACRLSGATLLFVRGTNRSGEPELLRQRTLGARRRDDRPLGGVAPIRGAGRL